MRRLQRVGDERIRAQQQQLSAPASQCPRSEHQVTDTDRPDAIEVGHVHDHTAPGSRECRQWQIELFSSRNIEIAGQREPDRPVAKFSDSHLHRGLQSARDVTPTPPSGGSDRNRSLD
jgi:hypothetical protein